MNTGANKGYPASYKTLCYSYSQQVLDHTAQTKINNINIIHEISSIFKNRI